MTTSVFSHNIECKVGVAVERYIAVYHPLYYNKVEIFKDCQFVKYRRRFIISRDSAYEGPVRFVIYMAIWTMSNLIFVELLLEQGSIFSLPWAENSPLLLICDSLYFFRFSEPDRDYKPRLIMTNDILPSSPPTLSSSSPDLGGRHLPPRSSAYLPASGHSGRRPPQYS